MPVIESISTSFLIPEVNYPCTTSNACKLFKANLNLICGHCRWHAATLLAVCSTSEFTLKHSSMRNTGCCFQHHLHCTAARYTHGTDSGSWDSGGFLGKPRKVMATITSRPTPQVQNSIFCTVQIECYSLCSNVSLSEIYLYIQLARSSSSRNLNISTLFCRPTGRIRRHMYPLRCRNPTAKWFWSGFACTYTYEELAKDWCCWWDII